MGESLKARTIVNEREFVGTTKDRVVQGLKTASGAQTGAIKAGLILCPPGDSIRAHKSRGRERVFGRLTST